VTRGEAEAVMQGSKYVQLQGLQVVPVGLKANPVKLKKKAD